MRGKTLRFLLLLGTLMLVIAAAGCGGDDDEGAAPSGTETGAGGPAGGTLVFGSSADPVVLDFALISDGESYRVMLQIYETLIQLKPGTSSVVPGFCEMRVS